jgi:hypothetical protein
MTVKLEPKVVFCLCFGGAHTAVGCAGEKPEQDGSRNFFIFLGLQFSESLKYHVLPISRSSGA